LKRLRSLADHHAEVLSEARAKSAQAMGQVLVCALLVPVFGGALYLLLPGVSEHPLLWSLFCVIAVLFSGCGALWLLSMTKAARWAGLSLSQRSWVLSAQCMGERVLALVRSGNPPDLAWTRGVELLSSDSPELALRWGYSVFESGSKQGSGGGAQAGASPAVLLIVDTGASIRKAIQVSLMEGRPCTDRVESLLLAFRQELRTLIDRELGLLATRALKPLFLFVAPSILGLLGLGVWLMWQSESVVL
jgi:Na+/proline symporter